VRVSGVAFDWQATRAELRVARRRIASCRTGALSDREYLDSLYPAFYRDLLQNLSSDAWRASRIAESLKVGAVLIDLLERVVD
jgi:hypothetical protein